MPISLMVASTDEHFREMIHENLLNIQNAKVVAEYTEISSNLYIRVMQDLERTPDAALILDLAADQESALKALEKVKQAVPDLYVVVSNYHADGETVISSLRSGASDFLLQPLKRVEFRDAVTRLEKAPRRTGVLATSKIGRIYSFLGAKGGVGTTTLAVNFASVLAQRKQQVVMIDLDWIGNDVAMQVGAAPQYTLNEVGENLSRMDQALFEGFVTRDPLGFFLVGPPDSLETKPYFTEPMFREFSAFLVDKYESIVVDVGRNVHDEVVMGALQVSSMIFLVLTQEYPSLRNAQRYIGYLMRMGFSQDQIRIVVNRYNRKTNSSHATLEQIQQTLNQQVFYGIPDSPAILGAINKARPLVSSRESAPEVDKAFRSFVDKAAGSRKAAAKAGNGE
jgi:pilus assembly protein CpaE